MDSRLRFAWLLVAVFWGFSHSDLTAQEPVSNEVETTPTLAERVDTFFNTPSHPNHTGLLGKVYLQQQTDLWPIRHSGGNIVQGLDSLFNLPVMTLDLPIPFNVDLFYGYTNASTNWGRIPTWHGESHYMGATFYPALSERFRPFGQVGVNSNNSEHFEFKTVNDLDVHYTTVRHDTELLLNSGFEYDLFEKLGYRMTLDFETKGPIKRSRLSNDLIYWPHKKLFLRGGILNSLDGHRAGIRLGIGLTF